MDINGGNGYGGKGRRRGSTDFYRRVPKEMTEATKVGVIMSLLSVIIMILLFCCETYSFLHTSLRSDIEVDPNAQELLKLNFNVTLFDVHCDFVSVDVWDTLGTNLQNVTKDITKWHLDDQGNKRQYHGRNKEQRKVKHEEHKETLEEIAESNGGEDHAIILSPDNLQEFYKKHNFAIIDYYAPWCIWCQRLAPTWEKFAAQVKKQNLKIGVGKVDCVEHSQLCKDERVMAFPTLRWVEDGKSVMPDYRGDRTVDDLVTYAKRRMATSSRTENDDDEEPRDDDYGDETHHPGCQVSGHLMVNRVPGNLHMEAKSPNHQINSAMTNLTHRVNHLSFGTPRGPQGHYLEYLPFFTGIPEEYKHTNPMKDKFYPAYHFHEAFHHHLKVVSSHMEGSDYNFLTAKDHMVFYQILEESQLVLYDVQEKPEIKFLWDMSPMSVSLTQEGKAWYDYTTSLLAIIGGTYTALGLINATLLRIFKPKKI